MQNKIKFTNFYLILLLIATFLLTGSCGIYKKTDARDLPSSGLERAKKNIKEGRGISLKNLGGKGNSTFQFSSSNPLWRATLETLDFLPFANLDYSGGVVITDWYADTNDTSTSLKITVRFLSNEISSNSLKIIVHQRTCSTQMNCSIKILKSQIQQELVASILEKAVIFEKTKKVK
jgi:hypothetical protein